MLIVLDSSPDFASEVAEILPDEPVVHVADPARLAAATAGRGCVVVLGPGIDLAEGLAAVTEDTATHGLVVVVSRLLTRTMRAAMHAGAVDVLTEKDTPDQLRDAVHRAQATVGDAPVTSNAAPATDQSGPSLGKVFTVFSTKGGSGASVVATNLAVDLARRGLRTCLVDLDLQFGDVAIMLQLRPNCTMHDAALTTRLSPADLDDWLTPHDSGLRVLAAPDDPALADDITADGVARVLEALVQRFDRVVVDTPAAFTDPVLTAIDVSSQVVLVGTLDVPSIKNLRLGIATLRRLGVEADTMRLVMNRANSRVGLRAGEVERSFGIPVEVNLPSDRDVVVSLNHGVPMVEGHPRSPVSAGIRRLSALLEGESTKPMAQVARRAGKVLRRRRAVEAAATTTTN